MQENSFIAFLPILPVLKQFFILMCKYIILVYSINSDKTNLKGKGRQTDSSGQLIAIWLKELAMHRKCKILTDRTANEKIRDLCH